MADDWRATTDRALSNTELILRGLDQSRNATVRRPAQRSTWYAQGPTHASFDSLEHSMKTTALEQQLLDVTAHQQLLVQKSSLQSDLENYFAMQKSALMSEFDRCLAEIKAEADSFSIRNQRSLQDANSATETMRGEIKAEVVSKLNAIQDESEDLRRRISDERDKRMKMEKQIR
jgi:hypothetical protein